MIKRPPHSRPQLWSWLSICDRIKHWSGCSQQEWTLRSDEIAASWKRGTRILQLIVLSCVSSPHTKIVERKFGIKNSLLFGGVFFLKVICCLSERNSKVTGFHARRSLLMLLELLTEAWFPTHQLASRKATKPVKSKSPADQKRLEISPLTGQSGEDRSKSQRKGEKRWLQRAMWSFLPGNSG